MALAGPADQGQLVRLVATAHRILPKPCDPDELPVAVRRAYSLRDLLGSPSLTAVVGRIGSIPTLSTLYTKIAEELSYPDFSMAEVGDLVGQDAGIAAKLIQVANSALLGLRRPASTPAQAVRILGADLTRTLVLAADLFSRYDPAALKPFSIDALWEHSRKVAEVAGQVAQAERAGDRVGREAALAGLFHDIGRLAIASQLPGAYREVLGLMRTEGLRVADAERKVLGATHAEVGGYLLGLWGLPDALIEAVAWHHAPSSCPGTTFTALTAVHIAEVLAPGDENAQLDLAYLDRLGLADKVQSWAKSACRAIG
jgi:HD-like signal output (HDOD) protein